MSYPGKCQHGYLLNQCITCYNSRMVCPNHNLPLRYEPSKNVMVCDRCISLRSQTPSIKKVCNHNNPINGSTCWSCEVESQSNVGKCPHWIPINKICYICQRENVRREQFYSGNVNSEKNSFFGKTIMGSTNSPVSIGNDYIDPSNRNNTYPQTVNDAVSNCRDLNNRSKNDGTNSFMSRSLETVNFIENNNSKNIWSNPIINSSFPTTAGGGEADNIYMGINTRGARKMDTTDFNQDLHLRRSMLQPDTRQGNRFFEFKPTNTRRESYRDVGNQNAQKFQTQTEELYQKMNYTQAYDNAAGINRGGQ